MTQMLLRSVGIIERRMILMMCWKVVIYYN